MEPGQGDDKSHVPAPSLLPVAFAIGLVIVLVGLIVSNWIAVGIGAVDRVRVRRRLDPRPVDQPGRARPSRRLRPSKQVGASTSAATEATIAAGERYPRDRFLEGATLGLGAVIGAVVTHPAARAPRRVGLRGPELPERRPRPARGLPGRQVHHHDLRRGSRGRARSRGAPPTSATTASSASCRASRSSRTAARTSAVRCSRTGRSTTNRKKEVKDKQGTSSCRSRRCSRPASAARATAASTTPRATAPPARRFARSTGTRTRSSTAT